MDSHGNEDEEDDDATEHVGNSVERGIRGVPKKPLYTDQSNEVGMRPYP